MPSRSAAQRRKMAVLHRQGKITDAQWAEYKHIVPKKKAKVRKRRK
jgi:hypothetical protein